MEGQQFLAADRVTVADFVAAYTLDMATLGPSPDHGAKLLDHLPRPRAFLDRMYARPKAPPYDTGGRHVDCQMQPNTRITNGHVDAYVDVINEF